MVNKSLLKRIYVFRLARAIIIFIFNIPRIIYIGILGYKHKYNSIVDICSKWLQRKEEDSFSIIQIAFAYAAQGYRETGFEYIKKILLYINSSKNVERILSVFIYPEYNQMHYQTVIDRCSYFNFDKLTENMKVKIQNIVLWSHQQLEKSLTEVNVPFTESTTKGYNYD